MKTKLRNFIKGNLSKQIVGCANWFDRACIFYGPVCRVEAGFRCPYFEQAVLPSAEAMGKKEEIYRLYQEQVGIKSTQTLHRGKINRCRDCGKEIPPRKRFCNKCLEKRRKEKYYKGRK